jgi:ABC-2 type transport system ATP-binding protein
MEEAEKISKEIAIIDKGRIMIIGSPDEIKKQTKTRSLEDAFLKLTGYDIREQSADNSDVLRRFRR